MDSPKTRLLADKVSSKVVADLVDTPAFQKAADTALLELIDSLPDSLNPPDAIAHYNRVIGARDFLKKFATVADRPKPAASLPSPTLNHKV